MILIANKDEDILACFPVMVQLRTSLKREEFVSRIHKQFADGYQLICLLEQGEVVCVAGFRTGSNLAWGNFFYVDDLVTDKDHYSRGYGKQMVDWLLEEARREGCKQFHLDSGLQREEAHRFYQREGINITGFHFGITL